MLGAGAESCSEELQMVKKPYNDKAPCLIRGHNEHGEIAATCERCHSLALGQQRRQWEAVREVEHEKYLARIWQRAA